MDVTHPDSRRMNQSVPSMTTPAISALAARAIDPNRTLPEDERFIENAEAVICELFSKGSHNNLEGAFIDYQKTQNSSSSEFSLQHDLLNLAILQSSNDFTTNLEDAIWESHENTATSSTTIALGKSNLRGHCYSTSEYVSFSVSSLEGALLYLSCSAVKKLILTTHFCVRCTRHRVIYRLKRIPKIR